MKKIFLITVTALALGACSIFEDAPESTMVPVQISATIGESALSRASNDSWAEGDEIGITLAMGEEAKQVNIKYITDGTGEFTGEKPIYFNKPMTLTAYYPFVGSEGTAPVVGPEGTTPGILEVKTDTESQKPENQPSIDFLWATTTEFSVVDDKPVVSFEFTHKMSKLTFIFEKGDGADGISIKSYQVNGLILDGKFNTATGECASLSEGTSEPITVDHANLSPLIVFPQSLDGKTVTLIITDNEGQSYACVLDFKVASLVSGNNYQFTVIVNKTGLIVKKPSITNWDTTAYPDNNASSIVTDEGA